MADERHLFHELMGDVGMTVGKLQEPLGEICSGTSSFGPRGEWHEWYHYLLGQLLPRCHETFVSPLLESLITGFFAIYPNGIHASPYQLFHSDILSTLGSCMMDPRCWNGDDIVVGSMLHRSNNNPKRVWCWWSASGDFSASMFLCLKYLPPALVPSWFKSVLAIGSPHWRAQVLVWLVGSNEMLRGAVCWPSEFRSEAEPSVAWDWSHCLRAELAALDESGATPMDSFIPDASRAGALAVASAYFTEDVYRDWLESISRVPYLQAELAGIPSAFEQLYVGRGAA